MSITGPGSITAANLTAQTNMFKQLNALSQELGTGDASQTYSGLGSQAGVALSLESQIAAFNAYSTTASTVGTTLTLAQSVLTQLDSARTSVQQALNQQNAFSLNGNGQTATQQQAAGYLDQILSLLNTQAGDNYMFSGSAVNQPSVASASTILNGNGAQAGLTQVISERLQADEGVGNQGRLTIGRNSPRRHANRRHVAVWFQAGERQLESHRRDGYRAVGLPAADIGQPWLQSQRG